MEENKAIAAARDDHGRWIQCDPANLPPGVQEVITLEQIQAMSLDEANGAYAKIIRKVNYKDQKTAIDSLVYQVKKLPEFISAGTLAVPKAAHATDQTEARTKAAGESRAPRSITYKLLTPNGFEKLVEGLAPQARGLVSVMLDLTKEKADVTFTDVELMTALEADSKADAPKLSTRQARDRIVTYYRGALIGKGLIQIS